MREKEETEKEKKGMKMRGGGAAVKETDWKKRENRKWARKERG